VLVMIPVLFWPFFFDVPALFFLGFWFLMQVFSGTLALAGPEHVGGVAFWAHVGGFGAGVLLHRFFLQAGARTPGRGDFGSESAWIRRHL
jgi:membrane associated rhomboid family serine protease